ncbi:MAG: hypothetical protein Tsb0017_20520 [Geothermobacteraceae bacterium]
MDETINVTITEEQIVINAEVTAAGPPGPPGQDGQDATLPQTATQAEMEAGIETALRMVSPQLVAQAAAKARLAGASETVNAIGAVTTTLTMDYSLANVHTATLGTSDCTISITNPPTGCGSVLLVRAPPVVHLISTENLPLAYPQS